MLIPNPAWTTENEAAYKAAHEACKAASEAYHDARDEARLAIKKRNAANRAYEAAIKHCNAVSADKFL